MTVAGKSGRTILVPVALSSLLVLGLAGCSPERADRVEISAFDPASGVYEPGGEAVSSLRVRNNAPEERTFWVGYSVQDPGGYWHDAPARRVTLEPGKSTRRESSWQAPDEPPPPSGSYRVAMAVWSEHPEEASEEQRLADVQHSDAFRVSGLREDFRSLEGSTWNVSSKKLGLGRLEPENVGVRGEELWIQIPAGTFDGGEIKSEGLYLYGSYRARIKVADAPSSLTGFFLYREPDLENELDVEIHNDSSGRILFTSYSGGEETNTVRKELPFDPTADFHVYRFDLYPDRAEFYVDGELMHTFDEGLPDDPMNLYVNAWFPTWLAGERAADDSYTRVDWIRH